MIVMLLPALKIVTVLGPGGVQGVVQVAGGDGGQVLPLCLNS